VTVTRQEVIIVTFDSASDFVKTFVRQAGARIAYRVGNKVSMIYIMDIYHDFIMIFCGENIMIFIDENIRTILL
jgi:hypothetical protein